MDLFGTYKLKSTLRFFNKKWYTFPRYFTKKLKRKQYFAVTSHIRQIIGGKSKKIDSVLNWPHLMYTKDFEVVFPVNWTFENKNLFENFTILH